MVPQLVGMALYCEIIEDTLHRWRHDDDKKPWAELCARVMGEQQHQLLNLGLARVTDNSITKLMLMKHGFTDRQEIKQEVKQEVTLAGSLSTTSAAEMLDELKKQALAK